jgi:hypothetical protein
MPGGEGGRLVGRYGPGTSLTDWDRERGGKASKKHKKMYEVQG